MSANGTIRLVWSRGEDDFCAAKIGTILQLEERCGAGIAEILTRLENGTWRINDVRETIRLALIGGGMSPTDAMKAVELHVHGNPEGLAASVFLAHAILTTVLIGVQGDNVGKSEAVEAKDPNSFERMDASAAQQFTGLDKPSDSRRGR